MSAECRAESNHLRSPATHTARPVLWMAAVVLSLVIPLSNAASAEPDWPAGPYRYIVIDQSVADALVEFGRNIRTPVRVSEKVRGRLSAGMPIGTAREFLDSVCQRYGLVWHYDGAVLNIATDAEIQTAIIRLDANSSARAIARLDQLGIADTRFPIKLSEESDVISVSGPPSYLALVRDSLGVSSGPAYATDAAGNRIVPVRVFRGKTSEARNVPITSSD